jgi:hypothetical protein
MLIDLTPELAPLLWGLVVLLLASVAALMASIDPEVVEIHVGSRRLLAIAGVVVVFMVLTFATLEPEIARALRVP